jgi:transcription elongation factor GreA-like protein
MGIRKNGTNDESIDAFGLTFLKLKPLTKEEIKFINEFNKNENIEIEENKIHIIFRSENEIKLGKIKQELLDKFVNIINPKLKPLFID